MVENLAPPAAQPEATKQVSSVVSDDVADFELPSSSPKKTKLPETASVQIRLQLFSNNSELCGLPGVKDKVVAMMIAHQAKPSLVCKDMETFSDFLQHVHST